MAQSVTAQELLFSFLIWFAHLCCLVQTFLMYCLIQHQGKWREIFHCCYQGSAAVTWEPYYRQLPAGSRAFSMVSSNPSGSKCWESNWRNAASQPNQVIMGGAAWTRCILRNISELTFRDQTKPRKYFPSLVVIILWGSFLYCKTAGEMQNHHCFYEVLKQDSSIGHCLCKMKKQQ